ncbi:CG3603 [Drosophila busckii]|uniref:CG3603 n=1 Tax=Drosophila busckii TaxID=30019 RepID=A0A0M5J5P8_DROBS|nr:3-oxoacyl-[acyl-carrier-protein] reductase FabG [Drosophila busckii]ALC48156.1 CG3603 [Drosophila busckii]
MSLRQKVVIVTGASSGIGVAIAQVLAREGAQLALVGRNLQNLQATQTTLEQQRAGVQTLIVVADVTTQATQIVQQTVAKFGRIDVLVNNAGILGNGALLDLDMQEFDAVLNTNLRAVVLLTKAVLPQLLQTKGAVVNVSSCAGLRPFAGALSYGISKAALDQFTRIVSQELAPQGVRVNSVNPGFVVTNIHQRIGIVDKDYESLLHRAIASHPMGRVGDVLEVAEAVAFLASSKASFTTGALLPIDGGKHNYTPR